MPVSVTIVVTAISAAHSRLLRWKRCTRSQNTLECKKNHPAARVSGDPFRLRREMGLEAPFCTGADGLYFTVGADDLVEDVSAA